MAKKKETDLVEEIREEEPLETKGPLRDEPEPEPSYSPAWEVVNDRQNILTDKIPPKIYSVEALIAAGVLNETNLAAYLTANGYVKNTDYATGDKGGVVKVNQPTYGTAVGSTGLLQCAIKDGTNYESANVACFISKGTLENMKADITARALVGIAEAQVTPTATGNYNVLLHYDADVEAWGVIISPAT